MKFKNEACFGGHQSLSVDLNYLCTRLKNMTNKNSFENFRKWEPKLR